MKSHTIKASFTLFRTLLVVLLALITLFPFYYLFVGSFFSIEEFSTYPPKLFPLRLTLNNYLRAVKESPLLRFILNSLVVSSVGSVLRIAIAVLAAFAIVFLDFKARQFFFLFILGTMFLPTDAFVLENFLLISRLGMIDTFFGIISIQLLAPVQFFLLRQTFKSIPHEFREAAAMDGSGDFHFLLAILLPMTRSIVALLVLQSFVTIWNSYLWPLLVTNEPMMRTVQVGITMLGYTENLDFGPIFAAIVIVVLPTLILFITLRKQIVAGIASSVTS